VCVCVRVLVRVCVCRCVADALSGALRSYNGYFVDLFVRKSNTLAIRMYERLGYVVYRVVLGYYASTTSEDAYGSWTPAVAHGVCAAASAVRHRCAASRCFLLQTCERRSLGTRRARRWCRFHTQ
jgi:hypothetical protein